MNSENIGPSVNSVEAILSPPAPTKSGRRWMRNVHLSESDIALTQRFDTEEHLEFSISPLFKINLKIPSCVLEGNFAPGVEDLLIRSV